MGLTAASVGGGAVDHGLHIERQDDRDLVIALAGNPNVGKSTVFGGRLPCQSPMWENWVVVKVRATNGSVV